MVSLYYTGLLSVLDRLQLVATAVVDRHGPVLTVSVRLPQHLANKKTSPVRLPSKFDEKTRPDRTFKLYRYCVPHVVGRHTGSYHSTGWNNGMAHFLRNPP